MQKHQRSGPNGTRSRRKSSLSAGNNSLSFSVGGWWRLKKNWERSLLSACHIISWLTSTQDSLVLSSPFQKVFNSCPAAFYCKVKQNLLSLLREIGIAKYEKYSIIWPLWEPSGTFCLHINCFPSVFHICHAMLLLILLLINVALL